MSDSSDWSLPGTAQWGAPLNDGEVLARGWVNPETFVYETRLRNQRQRKAQFDPRIRSDSDACRAGFANYETYRQHCINVARRGGGQ